MVIYSSTKLLQRILTRSVCERSKRVSGADHPCRAGERCIILSLAWLVAASAIMLSTSAVVAEGGQSLRTDLGQLTKPGLPLSIVTQEKTTESYASPWVRSPQGKVRLVSTVTGVGTVLSIRLGLQFNMLPHWKIYWRTPGDAGYPPAIDWSGSQNLARAALSWPVPQRFSLQGIETAGYKEEVVFPITATLVQPGSPLWIQSKVDFLACAEICVPQEIKLELSVLDGPAEPSPFMHLVERHAALVPGDGKAVGLRLVAVTTRPGSSREGGFIEVDVEADPPLTTPELFIEGPEDLRAGAPRVLWREGRRITLQVPTKAPVAVGVPVTLTIVDGDGIRALEATVTLTAATVAGTFAETSPRLDAVMTLAVMLGLAFLGGLILNLMPCVLPVLSLKVLILISHGGRERQAVRWSFVASAAGILFSFLLLAVTAMAVKAAGAAVGWGIQFQQSLFLTIMIVVLTLFAANLWGLFEFTLPLWLTDLCGGPHKHGYYTGAFLIGAFATLLATPCSAPFLSTAVGFALARGPLEILLIFAGLGIGMALPYLLVAAFPVLAVCLPRPGRWMLWLRWFMGLALAATALWLLIVLRVQQGEVTAILTGTAMATVMGMLILRRCLPVQWRSLISVAVILLTFLIIAVQVSHPRQELETVTRPGLQDPWLPFDEDAIERHVAKGRVVFVNITADWCVTCQINKLVVLSRGAVAARLGIVVAMQADWTRPDAKIAAYMARFGRYGIPFDAVYGPGVPQGFSLPELLTTETVLQALDMAAGETPL